jgi:hypothetical protein
MSEPAIVNNPFFVRAMAGLIVGHHRKTVDSDSIMATFDVYDPLEDLVDLKDLETTCELQRICRVELSTVQDEKLMTVTIRDIKTVENDDGEQIEKKVAMHSWVLNIQSGRHAPVEMSHHQIVWDTARGGAVDISDDADLVVPATSYLRTTTTTTEEVVQMVERLRFKDHTPLDFSTVQ